MDSRTPHHTEPAAESPTTDAAKITMPRTESPNAKPAAAAAPPARARESRRPWASRRAAGPSWTDDVEQF